MIMAKDVILEAKDGLVIFSCPFCKTSGAFPRDVVRGIKDISTSLKCPNCSSMVDFNKYKIVSEFEKLRSENLGLKSHIKKEGETEAQDSKHAGNLILVICSKGTIFNEIRQMFSGEASVASHEGSLGAVRFIKSRIKYVALIVMDVFLGDGTCLDVLERIKGDEEVSNIPIVLVTSSIEDDKVIENKLSAYPQVNSVINRGELTYKLRQFYMTLTQADKGF